MKKRYMTIIAFTAVAVLAGSVAYAAERRKKSRQGEDESNRISEEILAVELLSPGEEKKGSKQVAFPGKDDEGGKPEMEKEYAALVGK